ncbi:MAG: NFACT RNA binding domain-containing protein [Candidatus Riflebacteria bacterium]|nr:NFACT RNA binding domain-containing protein [Candidatus Riflebacteria bacterium]
MDLFTLQKHILELQSIFAEKPFVQRVFSGLGRTVNFRLRFKENTFDLSLTLDLPAQGPRLANSCKETDKNLSIVKTLNRLVTNARVYSIKCLPNDRVVKIHFVAIDAYFGNRRDYYLICEFTGRVCDIYVCDEELKIIDRLGTASNNRVGAVYAPLAPADIVPPIYLKEAKFRNCSVDELLGATTNSVFLYAASNKLRAFSVYELKHMAEKPTEIFNSVNEALNYTEDVLCAPSRFMQLKERVAASINKDLKQKRELLQKQADLKEKYADADKLQTIGNLIIANLYRIKPRMRSIEVENWETQENVSIELDLSKTPAANAKKYFSMSKKAKRGIIEVEKRINELENDIKWLEEELWLAENAAEENDLFVEKSKYQNKDKTREKNKVKAAKPDFETDNCMFFVGKSAKQNDFLTFKVAKNEDYWFHAKDVPGAHVILKLKEGAADENDILTGAILAAKNSFAKSSDKVLVEYTKVKNVKRAPNGGLGRVFYINQKSILVNPLK